MVDWDWEMPALFIWFFGAAGVVLAAPADARAGAAARRARLTRAVAGLASCSLAVTPLTVASRSRASNRSIDGAARGDCATATDAALGQPRRAAASQAEAFEVLGWCDARAGQHQLAVAAMRNAQRRDPDNWHYAYGLAVVQALAGEDPRPQRAARRCGSTRSSRMARALARAMRSNSAARRRAVAATSCRSRAVNDERRAGARLSDHCVIDCALALVAGATAEHEARAQQRDAAEQDRDGREAGERQARAGVGARLDLPRGLDVGATAGALPPPLFSSGEVPPTRVLVAEDAAAAGRRRLRRTGRCSRCLPGQAGDREACAGGAQQHAEHEHRQDDHS